MPLDGCARAPSEALCLDVVPYGRGEQAAVADELVVLGPASQMGGMIADYGRLRDEARALCR
jgi:hypothetical protein